MNIWDAIVYGVATVSLSLCGIGFLVAVAMLLLFLFDELSRLGE